MPERDKDSDRWRELAEMLGLPPDAEAPAPPARPAPPPREQPRAAEAEEPRLRYEPPPAEEPPAAAQTSPAARIDSDELVDEGEQGMEITTIHGAGNDEPIGAEPGAPPAPRGRVPAEGDDEQRRRRRRRGR